MEILGIDNVLVEVGNLGNAVAHYTSLGLTMKFHSDERGIAIFAIGRERPGFLLRRASGRPTGTTSATRLWLEVPDARAAADTLATAGVKLLAPAFQVATGWTVEAVDADGSVVGFTDYVTRPELGRPRRA